MSRRILGSDGELLVLDEPGAEVLLLPRGPGSALSPGPGRVHQRSSTFQGQGHAQVLIDD